LKVERQRLQKIDIVDYALIKSSQTRVPQIKLPWYAQGEIKSGEGDVEYIGGENR
jgi:hypothetical protein